MMRLQRPFFARPARVVAQDLLGKRLVRSVNGRLLAGTIVETEAYCDSDEPDLACHGHRANGGKPTSRTAVMFGSAGFAYVYFSYGIHWLFNVVTGEPGQANAVLVRALQPVLGVDEMQRGRNGRSVSQLTNGPAKLTQALQIDKLFDGANLCDPNGVLWIDDAPPLPAAAICCGPRIGLGKTPEPWFSMPWRYWVRDNPFVSV
ncbi:MAG: DNA-3-methyladenine glycosylase [Anaerolineales bacterium]|nr:DNA-3-methyladenine glycosylase [Anaerolineales bacterium]